MWTYWILLLCFEHPESSFWYFYSTVQKRQWSLGAYLLLTVAHHLINPISISISRLPEILESLILWSLLMWKSSADFNLPCSSFCYQLLRSEKVGYLFCLFSIFIIPNTYLLFFFFFCNHHRALHLHYIVIKILITTPSFLPGNSQFKTLHHIYKAKNHFLRLCCRTILYSEFNLPFYHSMSQDLSSLQKVFSFTALHNLMLWANAATSLSTLFPRLITLSNMGLHADLSGICQVKFLHWENWTFVPTFCFLSFQLLLIYVKTFPFILRQFGFSRYFGGIWKTF